jgi:signal transduction histidine kinase
VPAEEARGRTTEQVLQRRLESDGETPSGDRLIAILRGREEIWLSVTEAIMRDPAGLVAGRIFAFRDISTERIVEEMKSEFVSAVSHELRAPLTSIYGFAQTLLREDVDFGEDERRTFLRYIASETERLTGIVDALLNVARLDTGDLQVNLGPTDVHAIVEDVVGSAQQSADVNGHRFVLDLPEERIAAEADPDKLRQVLAQLVDNAIRYSPDGGQVTVAARRKTDTVEFVVGDEGIGIPQAEQQRIFSKFYRGDSGREGSAGGGTGLGLFIVQGLVEAMGGRIRVDSAEGEGSRFAFELPAATPAAAGAEQSE